MRLKRTRSVTLIVVLAFAGLYAVFAVLAAAPALAVSNASGTVNLTAYDQSGAAFLDGRGELIGYAAHRGGLRCDEGVCGQQTQVQLLSSNIVFTVTYSFESLQAVYPDEERVVVAGTGVMSRYGQTTAFPFEATFWNNGDGTIYARYDAAHPEASFSIPRTSGSMLVTGYDFVADASHAD